MGLLPICSSLQKHLENYAICRILFSLTDFNEHIRLICDDSLLWLIYLLSWLLVMMMRRGCRPRTPLCVGLSLTGPDCGLEEVSKSSNSQDQKGQGVAELFL